ncbi:zincin-like metallopeptidase domain-containing protein [Sinorhizobium sp. 8-89]|uniref:zincin-like metallopeptidase domain-containing protein n=1 Tax=Sinorhizobium sp. 7-81 TaxID=3049087 RepID=UPI0024C2BD34|nr:zincin-like metallopeptidase domain-containing protein [Sinorhizobium sp. 7-81]
MKTVFGGSEAYHLPSSDTMPPFTSFRDAAQRRVILCRMIHEPVTPRFEGQASPRSFRPLRVSGLCRRRNVTEILNGLVLADLGIAHHPRPDHAAYVASLLVLKDDPKAIFIAASKTQQAADWMHAQQPEAQELA